ncbi:MAG: hypothetical protein UZ22_OP11002000156 [Microgenomates bacterium OLB23]|nr:MAG: hypothetical protein UZ22_OP11002000156 [Microgenomates bacterium OLB23]
MFIAFLSSISKIAIVAFAFTFVAILIELYLISRKEKKNAHKRGVVLPDFQHGVFGGVQPVINSPLEVKKVQAEHAPHQISPSYVFGLIAVCGVVFIATAFFMFYKGGEEVVEAPLPTRVPKATAKVTPALTVTAVPQEDEVELLDYSAEDTLDDVQEVADEVQLLAQAPSPTPFSPTATLIPTIIITAVPTTITPTQFVSTSPTLSPTVTKKPTLLQTGGSYSVSLVAIVASFALIAIAFIL